MFFFLQNHIQRKESPICQLILLQYFIGIFRDYWEKGNLCYLKNSKGKSIFCGFVF